MKACPLKTVLAVTMAVFMLSCAGSLKGSKEEKPAYFDRLEQETLARLIKEYPQSEQQLVEAAGYTIAEKTTVKVPFVGVGEGIGLVMDKASNMRSYLQFAQLHVRFRSGGPGDQPRGCLSGSKKTA